MPGIILNMKLTYVYKLKPTSDQVVKMKTWLNLLRLQYNYRLAERFNWWSENRCDINSCSIVSCSIAPLKDRPTKYGQVNDLPNSKKLFPEYKDIYSQVLQECVIRVDRTFERFIKGSQSRARVPRVEGTGVDFKGNRSGKPRFKPRSRYRSFTYPAVSRDCLEGKYINLPKLGKLKVILHRPLPDGFKIKTATITSKSDSWFVNLSLEDKSVPEVKPDINPEKVCGVDVGLKEFLVTSGGETVAIPQFARRSEKRLKLLNKSLSRKKKKGTKNRAAAGRKLSLHHQKVARQRRDFHFKVAKKLLDKYDVIAHEDLNVKGLAKTKLAKSILDAGWTQFTSILTFKAAKTGLLTIAVNPRNTSQNCSGCGVKVPKNLKDRVHSCPACKLEIDRDLNAAINVKKTAEGHPVVKACGVRQDTGTMKQEAPTILLVS